jgi:hypothetical protein
LFFVGTFLFFFSTGSGKTTLCNTLFDKSVNLKLTALPDTSQVGI